MTPSPLAPIITIGGNQISGSAADYGTRPTAVAPLTITWGRNNLIGHPDPATATITLTWPAAQALPAMVRVGADVRITTTDNTIMLFAGTVRGIEIAQPARRGAPATATITATDYMTALTGARIYRLPGSNLTNIPDQFGGGGFYYWDIEAAKRRMDRLLTAVRPTAHLEVPPKSAPASADALTQLNAGVRSVGHKWPDMYSSNVWATLRPTLTAAAGTLHHTPTTDNTDTWTFVPWGEGGSDFPNPIPSRYFKGGLSATTSADAMIDLVEATYYLPLIGYREFYTPQALYRSRTLRTNPQTSLRLETDLEGWGFKGPGPKNPKDLTDIDRLITRVSRVLSANYWNLTNFVPMLRGHFGDFLIRTLINPAARCQLTLTLSAVPAWLGLGPYVRINPLGATNRWTGREWTIELNAARRTF